MKKLLFITLFNIIFVVNLWGATYFIDYDSGNDSAYGNSTASAWKRAPGMKGFSGRYTHSEGDRFIFKGGVRWPSSVMPWIIQYSGGATNQDYYGVDLTWNNGNSWSRPVFDAEFANLGSSSMGSAILINGKSNITLDNLEVKNLKAYSSWGPALVMIQTGGGIRIQNCYLKDWTINSGLKDDAHGAVIANQNGSVTVTNCIISNSAFKNNGVAIRNATEVSYCKIFDISSALLTVYGKVYNNEIYNMYPSFDAAYHTNLIYFINGSGTGYIFNNYIHHINSVGAFIYPNPCWGGNGTGRIFVYNNVIDAPNSSVPIISFDTEMGIGANCGSGYVLNNTIYSGAIHSRVTNRGGAYLRNWEVKNNHSISNSPEGSVHCYNDSYRGCGGASARAYQNNLIQPPSSASAQGYSSENNFSTIKNDASTVRSGVDLSGYFSSDINSKTRPPSLWDIGAYQYDGSDTCR